MVRYNDSKIASATYVCKAMKLIMLWGGGGERGMISVSPLERFILQGTNGAVSAQPIDFYVDILIIPLACLM